MTSPLHRHLDLLLEKPLNELTISDVIGVVEIARTLLNEKARAQFDQKLSDAVLLRDAVGNEFLFNLAKVGWRPGTRLPLKFELELVTRGPTLVTADEARLPTPRPVTRKYRLLKRNEWDDRPVYEEVVR